MMHTWNPPLVKPTLRMSLCNQIKSSTIYQFYYCKRLPKFKKLRTKFMSLECEF